MVTLKRDAYCIVAKAFGQLSRKPWVESHEPGWCIPLLPPPRFAVRIKRTHSCLDTWQQKWEWEESQVPKTVNRGAISDLCIVGADLVRHPIGSISSPHP